MYSVVHVCVHHVYVHIKALFCGTELCLSADHYSFSLSLFSTGDSSSVGLLCCPRPLCSSQWTGGEEERSWGTAKAQYRQAWLPMATGTCTLLTKFFTKTYMYIVCMHDIVHISLLSQQCQLSVNTCCLSNLDWCTVHCIVVHRY